MQTAYVVEAQFIDSQTIHINEPLNIENKDILVTIQPKNQLKKKSNKSFYFGCMKGHIKMGDDFNEPITLSTYL